LCRRTRGDNPSQNRAIWCAQERCEEDLTFSSVTFPSPTVGERHIILRSTSLDLSAFFPLFHNPPQPPQLPVRIHLPVCWATLTCTGRHCDDFTIFPLLLPSQSSPLLRCSPEGLGKRFGWSKTRVPSAANAPRRSTTRIQTHQPSDPPGVRSKGQGEDWRATLEGPN